MVEIIRIPKLGLSDYAEVVSWEGDPGEPVAEGDVVVVLESDKASAEIEAPVEGVLLETYVDEGEEVAVDVGKPLGAIGDEGESAPSLAALEDAGADDEAPRRSAADASEAGEASAGPEPPDSSGGDITATPRARRQAREVDVDLQGVEGTGPEGAVTTDDIERYLNETAEEDGEPGAAEDGEPKATPRAKRDAQERGVDLGEVEGTGPQGAVTADDVAEHAEAQPADGADDGGTDGLTVVEATELTGTRRTIAERLTASAREKPHVMGTREVGIEQLEKVRDRLDDEYDVEVSLNDLFLYFVGRVLADLPRFNAHFADGRHEVIEEVNVGYAVDGPRGLTVPVVEEVTERSLPDLAERRRELVGRVLDDDHTPADLQGGTFTVTNVGVFGIDVSYSIINPPEVAILAIGRPKYAPVERDGEVAFRKVVTCSLTIDHRVLDGVDSGRFLERLAEYVEHPGAVFDDVR